MHDSGYAGRPAYVVPDEVQIRNGFTMQIGPG